MSLLQDIEASLKLVQQFLEIEKTGIISYFK